MSLTLGKAGAVLATAAGNWYAQSPGISAVSAVGSGDSFLAGLITSLDSGLPGPEALRRAAAAGAANALRSGAGVFTMQDFGALLDKTVVRSVA